MNFRELIQIVKESLYCQVCGQSFDESTIELAGYQDNTLFFHAYCDRGHVPSNALIKAVAPTWLPIREIVSKYSGEPVTTDDVLDLKNSIKNFRGDFETLFKQS